MQASTSATTPILRQIETLVADIPGWTPIDQLHTLFQLAYSTADLRADILEIGSWCGRSAVVLGLAARLAGAGRVYCVDLFPDRDDWTQNSDGSYSFSVTIDGKTYGGHQEQTVWQRPFEDDIAPVYRDCSSLVGLFRQTIIRHQMGDLITPIKGNSDLFVRSAGPEFRCRLAFLDGEHSYSSVCCDIANVEKVLVPGGWICFDDAFSSYEGVNRAIQDRIMNNPRFELGQQITRKLFIARRRGD